MDREGTLIGSMGQFHPKDFMINLSSSLSTLANMSPVSTCEWILTCIVSFPLIWAESTLNSYIVILSFVSLLKEGDLLLN
jgi:hypothetical protein